jgi:hypothetical protein
MVISDSHRYVFVEVPQTASTALAAELIDHYGGRRILRKHTDYGEFLRTATPEERQYRVLATIRNPLDIVVSKFVKARDDHERAHGKDKLPGTPWGFRFRPEARERAFMAKHGPDFDRFVRRFYPRVYNSRACLLPRGAHVLRYERLNEDFAAWLKSIGVQSVGPIARKNITGGRDRSFAEWYQGDLQGHAVRIFGPYLLQWGYELPEGWPENRPSRMQWLRFRVDTLIRRFYLTHIHYGWVMPPASRAARTESDDD